MKSYVEASLEFYFRGERHAPSAIIPLDACMRQQDPLAHIYHVLAAENGIGRHSHEFDVMIMEPVRFSNPAGLAVDFVRDGRFDLEGFRRAWLEESILHVLQPIARRHLGIDRLDDHPDIKAALLEAYQAA